MKIGDKVTRTPRTFGEYMEDSVGFRMHARPMRGRVVYIHPKGRFHVVEFENARGDKIRETFMGV